MSFLQPMLLAALPLVGLPILIHLINQRRYQTVEWAAMMFLLAANRMSQGYARLKQWLILLFRVLAVAGLIFAVSRPMSGGLLGLAGGTKPDTTIVVFDRSASMTQQGETSVSKLETGRRQLVEALKTVGSTRWVLIDSVSGEPREFQHPQELLKDAATEPVAASADLPALLQSACEYARENQTGRLEVWVCSDLRTHDWQPETGRWQVLRDSFLELRQSVRFHLLAYPRAAESNVGLRVTDVRRLESSDRAELLVSLTLKRTGGGDRATIPLEFEIDGARSVHNIEMVGPEFELQDFRIELEENRERGWGKISLPSDSNPADNEFYFVFGKPEPRRTLIVADNPQVEFPLKLAAEIIADRRLDGLTEVVTQEQLAAADWEQTSLLLWQSALPEEETQVLVDSFVDRGGQVVFFPPATPDGREVFGVQWTDWVSQQESLRVETWRSEEGLLANTASGASLPVGQLEIRRFCSLEGDVTALASLSGGSPLLARVATDRGGVYFCSTTPAPRDSSLASAGVAFYVAIQRALAEGAAALGNTRQLTAGDSLTEVPVHAEQLAGGDGALSTEYSFHQGVFTEGEKLLAVNRDAREDRTETVDSEKLESLFQGLDMVMVNDRAGNMQALIQEIWRLFLAAMLVALVMEAVLCLPKPRRAEEAVA